MVKYRIEFNKAFLKDLKKIQVKYRNKILKKIDALADNPRPDGCKKLQGSSSPALYRIRCGDYRVIYTIEDNVLLIVVIEAGQRKEIYRYV